MATGGPSQSGDDPPPDARPGAGPLEIRDPFPARSPSRPVMGLPLSRRNRLLRVGAWGFLVLAALLLASAGILYALSAATPDWWKPASPEDPKSKAIAEAFESYLVTEANRVRPAASPSGPDSYRSAPWSVVVGQEEVNAWLASKLPRWAASRGRSAGTVQLKFEQSGMAIAAQVAGARVVSAKVGGLNVLERGIVLAEIRDIRVGRLPLKWTGMSAAGLVGGASSGEKPDTERTEVPQSLGAMHLDPVGNVIEVEMRAVAHLADGRSVRLVKLRTGDGFVELTCVTEK